ncbi:DoxX family membrane protein [Acetobacter sp. LMG 1627]|uniref:Methylamine utilization protein MauE n=2 Tax=Acetobacter conturbans TaxID=1737472 RepID=A0ABX0K3Y5_9PROT|nr:DoxX family membrane protein [Acetobacter conturbans]
MMDGLSAFCAGGVGVMFLVAGLAKLREHDLFLGTLASYRLLPSWSFEAVAWGLAVVEVLTGALLLSGLGRSVGALLAALMLVVFALAMGINMMRGHTEISCGCTPGQKGETLSWGLVFRTLGCALPALLPVIAGGHEALALQLEGTGCGIAFWVLWQALHALPSGNAAVTAGEHA